MSSESNETRNRILQVTLELLEEGDGSGVRMSDIARRANLSRQAIYLHFTTRADLLIAATFHLEEVKGSAARLAPSRAAKTGVERLDAFIAAWTAFIPEIFPVAKALMAMSETDAEAARAWNQRMQDMREGCEAAIRLLERDGRLMPQYSPDEAIDILWTLMQIGNWRRLREDCGWSQAQYQESVRSIAHRLFVAGVQST